jgi:prepilin-type N-terminal cleavage/methylation domain-containing protein
MVESSLAIKDQKFSSHSSSAFTIVELLVVIVIIAILATITIVSYTGITKQATTSSVQSNLKQLSTTIDLDHASTSTYPATSAAINSGKGLPTTSGMNYTYSRIGNTNYCVSATSVEAGITYHYTPKDGQVKPGDCSGVVCPSGFIPVPGSATYGTSDFCVMKYEAKNDGAGKAVSTVTGSPWVNIAQDDGTANDAISVSAASCASCHLITDNEWLTIAHNVLNVASNWSGGAVGSGYLYSGHNNGTPNNALAASTDNDGYFGTGDPSSSNQRRTLALSNGEVIWDLAGNVWEWTSGTFTGTFPTPADSWVEWNNSSLVMNSLSSTLKPSYGESAAVANWTGFYNGIGELSTGSGTGTRGLGRGGRWSNNGGSGVFSLDLTDFPSDIYPGTGFRVARG